MKSVLGLLAAPQSSDERATGHGSRCSGPVSRARALAKLFAIGGALGLTLGSLGCVGSTEPATDITETSAQLNATGRADDGPAYWWWEYGTDPSQLGTTAGRRACGSSTGATARCGPAGPTSTDVHLSTRVGGLEPDTAYVFRACGQDTNDATPTCAQVRTFRTRGAGPAELTYTKLVPGEGVNVAVFVSGPFGERRVTTTPGLAAGPVLSPDRRRIAFSRGDDLWVINVDGTGERNLTESFGFPARHPTWSPDGTRIAFDGLGIDVVGADGGPITTIHRADIDSGVAGVHSPSWSPDGSRIAFEAATDRCSGGTDREYDVRVVSASGGDERIVAQEVFRAGGECSRGAFTTGRASPDWSPDGTRVLFPATFEGTSFDLYTALPDGSGRQKVAATPDVEEAEPSWSPDGTRIAYTDDNRILNVFVMNANGSDPRLLVPDATNPDFGLPSP